MNLVTKQIHGALELETAAYYARVIAAGGVVINIDAVDYNYKLLKSMGLMNSLIHLTGSDYGLKMDSINIVSNLYSLDTFNRDFSGSHPVFTSNGLLFDANDVMSASTATTTVSDYTFMFEITPTVTGNFYPILQWSNIIFHSTTGASVYAGHENNYRFTPAELPNGTVNLNTENIFALTYSATTQILKFYKNGSLLSSKSCPVSSASNSGILLNYINGNFHFLKIFSTELSASQIVALSNN